MSDAPFLGALDSDLSGDLTTGLLRQQLRELRARRDAERRKQWNAQEADALRRQIRDLGEEPCA